MSAHHREEERDPVLESDGIDLGDSIESIAERMKYKERGEQIDKDMKNIDYLNGKYQSSGAKLLLVGITAVMLLHVAVFVAFCVIGLIQYYG